MTNRGPIHDLLPGWEPWKPEDHGGLVRGGCAGCGGDATGVDGDGLQRYANGTVVLTIKDHRPRRRSPDQNGEEG